MARYDVISIGGGAAGLVVTMGAAGLGARAALIERHRLGGECLWTGCVPSRALLACARAAAEARAAGRFGVDARDVRVDFSRVLAWLREAQRRIEPHDSPERVRAAGADVITGTARFTGHRMLSVDGRELSARTIVIATGSRPVVPPICGLADSPFLTNETVFTIERQPESLIVLGGGTIGLEIAQSFSLLGTRVLVLERESRILPLEDEELVEVLRDRLVRDGVDLRVGVDVRAVSHSNRRFRVEAADAGGDSFELDAEALLVATGRRPELTPLEPAAGGIEVGPDGIRVDRTLATTASGVWAAGDVTGGPRFTHVADYQARTVLRNALFPLRTRVDYRAVPRVTYTEPELARVGLSEEEARERHGAGVRVWRHPFSGIDRAIVEGRTEGMVKLIADRRGRLLGGQIVGHGAGNVIGEITLALKHRLTIDQLAAAIRPYPTFPEAIRQAAEQRRRSLLTGMTQSLVRWWVR